MSNNNKKDQTIKTKIIEELKNNPKLEKEILSGAYQDHQRKKSLSPILMVLLLIALGIILYQNFLVDSDSWIKKAVPPSTTPIAYDKAIDGFLKDLASSTISKQTAHQNLYGYVMALPNNKPPTKQQFKQYVENKDIPFDYRYFMNELMPNYLQTATQKSSKIKDNNILLSLPDGIKYHSSIVFNEKNTPVSSVENILAKNTSNRRLVITGTYTSPFNMPVGLAINHGVVVNPALQKWDGLLLIDKNGKIYINHIDELNYDFQHYPIRQSYQGYTDFLKLAAKNQLSVIQSHLLINNGKILVDSTNQKKFRRRIVFQTLDNSIHIYDSKDKEETLEETAKNLQKRFQAVKALNLDMGTYNFCKVYADNVAVEDLSQLGKGVILSNLLVFDY